MTHDRTYWRACDDKRLIDEARDSGHELCIALGERLDDMQDFADDIAELRDQIDELRRERDRLAQEVRELEGDD